MFRILRLFRSLEIENLELSIAAHQEIDLPSKDVAVLLD